MQVATLQRSLELALQGLEVASTIFSEQHDRVEFAHEGLNFCWEIHEERLVRIIMLETFCKGKGKGKMFPSPPQGKGKGKDKGSLDQQPPGNKGKGKGQGAPPPESESDSIKTLQGLNSVLRTHLASRFSRSASSASSA